MRVNESCESLTFDRGLSSTLSWLNFDEIQMRVFARLADNIQSTLIYNSDLIQLSFSFDQDFSIVFVLLLRWLRFLRTLTCVIVFINMQAPKFPALTMLMSNF
jgi:hypothetical protein